VLIRGEGKELVLLKIPPGHTEQTPYYSSGLLLGSSLLTSVCIPLPSDSVKPLVERRRGYGDPSQTISFPFLSPITPSFPRVGAKLHFRGGAALRSLPCSLFFAGFECLHIPEMSRLGCDRSACIEPPASPSRSLQVFLTRTVSGS